MNIGVLGTGTVGRTLCGALAARGHRVVMGTRDIARAGTKDDLVSWRSDHPDVAVTDFAAAAAAGAMVFNATSGVGSLEAVGLAGADNLRDKVLVDVANPLDFSRGMPPSLTVANTDSLGEQLQRALPDTRVVKALNTVNADVMVNPQLVADGEHDLFVCGDDHDAKAVVIAALKDWFGWRSIIDLGDITGARALEMYLPLWVRLMTTLDTPRFSVRLAR